MTERFAPFETHSTADSAPRIRRMRQLMSEHWGQLDVESIKDILSDHEETLALYVGTEQAARTRSAAI